uniref:Fusaric acid biosynthesis protein 2 n=1 Tax=Ganoderma boninense TaxID=34458 RepID=A0A5K1K1K6_9APHY|nr:Fusaric acid biosynthesis protein 2 [Ganoderma boninense]
MAERFPVTQLQVQIDALRKDRDDALALAATRQTEADSWKSRYEQLKPQLSQSAAMSLQLSDTIKEELVQFLSQRSTCTGGEDPAKFRVFMAGLPATVVTESFNQESCVVFKNAKKVPLLSKAAVKACIGGFAFFGTLLVWCTPPSQHACVVFPENEYNPKPTVEGAPKWSKTTSEWAALAGQQRELFYIDGENISYAGTFICHAGPKGANVSALGDTLDDTLLGAIAAKTLHLDMKNPKTRSSIFKTYPPLLANLYRESSSPATVQLLGLQRVGFNQTLFDILKAASRKRDRAAAFPDLPGGPSSDGVGSPAKRAALGFEDFVAI